MKKILSLILALLMIVSCASFIFADENEAAEVKESDSKYYDAVQFLVNYDIMHGKGDKLGVYDNIKRYEMALFIGRICTGWVADDQWEDGTEDKSGFVDLAGTAAESFYGAISYVAQKGIIVGVGGNKFAPEAGIKYEDALTMAVRALGYNDLAYPWGYIDKAVNLGLTAGIEGVAYSETLKREVVAQIVYNALFAATADGDTLAKKNFGLDLNYETIMITAADGGHYAPNGKDAPKGYVAYQVVEADGTLNSQVYYDTAESFGFTDEHDDERALGTLYKAVFNKNANNGLGTIVSAESLELDTVWNLGLNSLEAGAYPVAKYLANKTLVSRYAAKNAFNAGVNQFILVRDDNAAITVITDLVAVDWYTGNILVKDNQGVYQVAWYYNQLLDVYFRYQVAVKDNGDVTLVGVEYMTVDDAAQIYDNVGLTKVVVATNCYGAVTDTNEIKTLGKTAYASLRIFEGENYGIYDEYRFGYLTKTAPILDTSKLTKDTVGDSYDTIIAHRNDWFSGYSDEDFYALIAHPKFQAGAEAYVNEGFDVYDYSDVLNGKEPTKTLPFTSTETLDVKGARPGEAAFQNGGTTAWGKIVKFGLRTSDVWFTDGVEPEEGWVIYGANPSTNEVTIVKTIGEYTEGADSYVATGVLRSYNMAKKTLTIGDQTFSTEYNALAGTAFSTTNYVDGYWWAGTQYVAALFEQFVTYVVVDGKVVYIEACGNEDLRFLVVDSYAGIARDNGAIVINAWDTADGKNKQIRIANCDGWKFGDFFYYAANYTTEIADLFTRGTVLQILSYNPKTDAYGVTAIKGIRNDVNGKNAEKYSITNAYGTNSYDFTWVEFNFKFAQVGIRTQVYLGAYRVDPNWLTINNGGQTKVNGGNEPTSTNGLKRNMTKDDKYVFIFADGEIAGSPVRIFTGDAINPSWFVKGWRLVGTDGTTHIFMGLKASNVSGFNIDQSSADHTAVIMINYKDGANNWYLPELRFAAPNYQVAFGSDSRYEPSKGGNPSPWGYVIDAAYDQGNLIGATAFSATVLDLRTLKTVTVQSDKPLKWNFVYEVQNGKVVGDARDANDLFTMLNAMFVHDGIDLVNDTVIGKITDVTPAQVSAGSKPLRSADLNCWMTEQYLHVGGGYADFGSYTIPRKAKFASLVTVYEATDGHAEIAIIGTEDTDGNYSKEANKYSGKYSEADVMKLTGGATALKAVTLINMDRVKLQGNCNNYDGQMAVTYLFNADLVD